ncbi:hypothetical protein PA598K_04007 [Paenibacillus sp. 598K]|uniref:hypothetical protein n=1 Tax=Paenibacillus sp. 598K TaxID=1117987 RepID=UPI000FF97E18|nr:hypothetical protein [Paenibacillus sp. 598K]GBF75589.1 hypothetical protein PA598K_04007 [Paenibacillus sp. 598K]
MKVDLLRNRIKKMIQSDFEYKVLVGTDLYSVAFSTNLAEQISWLREYLSPYYMICEDETERVESSLFFTMDSSLIDLIREAVLGSDVKFVGSYRGENIKEYKISNELKIQKTSERESYIIFNSERSWFVLIMHPSDAQLLQEPSRVIREIMVRKLEKNNELMIHAGAVEKNGLGVMICGEKGSGKTTTVLGFIYYSDYNYISNDRIMLAVENNRLTKIKGVPFAAAIRLGTAFQYEKIQSLLKKGTLIPLKKETKKIQSHINAVKSLEEVEMWSIKEYIELLPSEIACSLDSKVVPIAKLGVLIFPIISQEYKEPIIRDVDYQYIKTVFLRECFTFKEDSYPDRFDIVNQSKTDVQNRVLELAQTISRTCICLEIKYCNFEDIVPLLNDRLSI